MKHPVKPKWLLPAAGCLLGYLVVLVLMTLAESADPDASIQSFSDALWYSIVTLSTVGYGDLYPVTPVGKLLGVVFVILSVGLLSFLIGAIISLFSNRLLPSLQLWLKRNRPWYVFSSCNEAALVLANDLATHHPDAIFLFPQSDKPESVSFPCIYYWDSLEKTVDRKKKDCVIFFMSGQSQDYTHALSALSAGHRVCCLCEQAPDSRPDGLTLFSPQECCAREYWRRQPLKRQEKTVLILGDGEHAKKLLFHGLLVNVFDGDHRVQYHAFGNWDAFRNDHRRMSLTIAIDRDSTDMDQVYFHKDFWNADSDLLYRADRIVICGENHGENLAILRKLRRYHATSGSIHLRFDSPIPGETVFGTIQQIYSEELVLQERLTWAAKSMHQLYCNGSQDKTPTWEELTPFQRQSNLSAADHLLTKIRLLLDDETITRVTPENCQRAYLRYCQQTDSGPDCFREIEHMRWMRFYSLYNWQFGPQRDNTARIHPMLLPYDQLSEAEQRKDDHAWELLKPLSEVIS